MFPARPGRHGLDGSKRCALILMNIQRDFMEGGAVGISGANESYIQVLNRLRREVKWDMIVLTRSLHSSNNFMFASNNPGTQNGHRVRLQDEEVLVWHDHCLEGDYGSFFPDELEQQYSDVIVDTGINPKEQNYGYFRDPNSRLAEAVANMSLFVAGMPFELAVKESAIQYSDRVFVVQDACLCYQVKHGEVVDALIRSGVGVLSVSDVAAKVDALRHNEPPSVLGLSCGVNLDLIMEYCKGRSDLQVQAFEEVAKYANDPALFELHPLTGRSILHEVCRINHENAAIMCQRLLELNPVIDQQSRLHEMTPIMYACANSCLTTVRVLISNPRINLKLKDYRNMTAIMHAIVSHDLNIVKAVVSVGKAWLLKTEAVTGGESASPIIRTPLSIACENAGVFGRTSASDTTGRGMEVLQHLISEKIFPRGQYSQRDTMGWQFWHYAVKHDLLDLFVSKLEELSNPQEMLKFRLPHSLQGFPVTLVTLAVWMASSHVKLTNFTLLEKVIELCGRYELPITYELDLVIEHIDPMVAFILVERGCKPWKKKGAAVRALLFKALMHGHAHVVMRILTTPEFDLRVGKDVLDFTNQLRYHNCCTRHFISNYASLPQVCYKVRSAESDSTIVCAQCALDCWSQRTTDIQYAGIIKDVCKCWLTLGDGCHCLGNRSKHLDQDKAEPQDAYPIRQPARLTNRILSKAQVHEDKTNFMVEVKRAQTFRQYVTRVFLIAACTSGQADIVRTLLESGETNMLDIDFALDDSHNTCLHQAAANNCVAVIQMLKQLKRIHLEHLTNHNQEGYCPLAIACIKGHDKAASELCEFEFAGESLAKFDFAGLTPLHYAVKHGHTAVVDVLARRISTGVFGPNSLQQKLTLDNLFLPPPSHQASSPFDFSIVDKSAMTREPGEIEAHASPLHLSVRWGRPKCAEQLIAAGANPFAKDGTGFSPYKTTMWEHYKTRKLYQDHEAFGAHSHRRASEQGKTARDSRREQAGRDAQRGAAKYRERMRAQSGAEVNPSLMGITNNPLELRSHPPDVAENMVLAMHKHKRVKKRSHVFAYTRFYLMSIWYLLMATFYLVFTVPNNSDRFYTVKYVEDVVVNTTLLSELVNVSDMYSYLHSRALSDGSLIPSPTRRNNNVTTIGVMLLGSIRLWQARSNLSVEECIVDPSIKRETMLARWHDDTADTVGIWGDLTSEEAAEAFGTGAVYRPNLDEAGVRTGDFGNYGSGGFEVILHRTDIASNRALLEKLEQNNWVDKKTRAVFLDFNIYNFNLPMFTSCRVRFEFGPTGEMAAGMTALSYLIFTQQATDSQIFSLNDYSFPSDRFTIVSALLLTFLVISELNDIIEQRLKYFKHVGNLYDVLIVACVTVMIAWEVQANKSVDDIMPISSELFDDNTNYIPVLRSLYLTERLNDMLGIILILIWVRVLQYTVYLPTFGPIVGALVNTLQEPSVLAFIFLLLFFILGFMFSVRTAMSDLSFTSEYPLTFALLFNLMLGEWGDSVGYLNRIGTLLLCVFVLVMTILFINIFISVISEVYDRVKTRTEQQYADSLNELIETDYVKRTNPLLKHPFPPSRLGPSFDYCIKVLYTITVRPFLDVIARLLGLILSLMPGKRIPSWLVVFHPNIFIGNRAFGWEKGPRPVEHS